MLLCACNSEKTYTITGTLDLPDHIEMGDTILPVPSLEDEWVYIMDLENEAVDSTQIHDNKFSFSGKVKPDECYFVVLGIGSKLGQSLIAIEPGDIEVYMDQDDITVTGTPSNDCIADLDAAQAKLTTDTYAYFTSINDSLLNLGMVLSDSLAKPIVDEYESKMNALLDSAYNNNQDNLGGVYIVSRRYLDVTSSAELEQALEAYPEKIRNNELIQVTLRMFRQYEEMYQYGSGLEDLDPSMFAPAEEEGAPQQ